MDQILELLRDPAAWVALATLLTLEVVLGIDNLIFISILTNKLPEHQRGLAQKIGIAGALVLRLALLGTISYIVALTAPVFSAFGQDFSWKDLILIVGGLFLIWKATKEIHHSVQPGAKVDLFTPVVAASLGMAVAQILLLDLVFSVDSIITAVGMTPHIEIMFVAVVSAVLVMLVAAGPLSRFVAANPTVVMLALSFLMLIGTTLVAEGFGAELPKAYVYGAMAFSALVEALNILARRARRPTEDLPIVAPAKA